MDCNLPKISIIIPFYGYSFNLLYGCIKNIEQQTYCKEKIEIIIIDNNENKILTHQFDNNSIVRVAHEPKPGSYSARNKGIQLAKGEIIAFTDSDCLPNLNWINHGLKALKSGRYLNVIGGRIVFTFKNINRPNIFELIDSVIHLRQVDYIENMHYAATANLFVPKSIFLKYGEFNPNYFAGGDREWGERLKQHDVMILFCSEAIVYHPARSTFSDLIRKNRRAVGGDVLRLQDTGYNKFNIFSEQQRAYSKRIQLLESSIYIERNKLFACKTILFIIYFIRFLEAARLLLGGAKTR